MNVNHKNPKISENIQKKKNIFLKLSEYDLFLTKAAYVPVTNKFLNIVEI